MTAPLRLNLGCGKHPIEGYVNVDNVPGPGVNVCMDLDSRMTVWPWGHDTVDEVVSSHMIEHLDEPLVMMERLWRVCRDGATAEFSCPYGSSDDADENPTHVRRMFYKSWSYFGQPNYWREDYGYKGDWAVEKIELRLSEEQYTRYYAAGFDAFLYFLDTFRNVVTEQVAMLRCVKPAREAKKELQEGHRLVVTVIVPHDGTTNRVMSVEDYEKEKGDG